MSCWSVGARVVEAKSTVLVQYVDKEACYMFHELKLHEAVKLVLSIVLLYVLIDRFQVAGGQRMICSMNDLFQVQLNSFLSFEWFKLRIRLENLSQFVLADIWRFETSAV